MRNKLLSIAAAVSLMAGSAAPGLAEDGMEMAKNAAFLPVRVLGIGAGLVVGTPVALLRRTSNRCIEYTGNFAEEIGGKDNLPPMMFASLMGVPFGLVAGTAEGVYYGSKNGVITGFQEPFSLGSMSLGEDIDTTE